MKTLGLLLIVILPASLASAATATVRSFTSTSLTMRELPAAHAAPRLATTSADDTQIAGTPETLRAYPVAGTPGVDFFIPYFVDLDPTAGTLDWNCGHRTFDGHTGHDVYIRSFTEQEIGVPVFAPVAGVVTHLHDGEPDHNIAADPAARSNYVVLSHGATEMRFEHLAAGSILVREGQLVSAGTQLASIGSSGASSAPHLHFEARTNDDPYEVIAGPCHAGMDLVDNFDATKAGQPFVLSSSLSDHSFDLDAPLPVDDAPHTGTFVRGPQTIYVRSLIGNYPAGTPYRITVRSADGSQSVAGGGTFVSSADSLRILDWALDVNLDRTGTWEVGISVDGVPVASLPFTVVRDAADIVNRAPADVTAQISPAGLRGGRPAVCTATGLIPADPDYDVVRYHYVWRSADAVVRDVTTAVRSDILASDLVTDGASLSCSVTASDGTLESQTSTAYAVPRGVRRRSVR